MRKILLALMLVASMLTIAACGGGGGGGSSTPTTDSGSGDSGSGSGDHPGGDTPQNNQPFTGVVVDPYIEGASFCVDLNGNGSCDEGETVSTPSNSNGEFTFSSTPPAGTKIIMKTAGTHNGVPYSYDELMATFDPSAETVVVSPLTTVKAKGLTSAQIVEMLTAAGLNGVTEEGVTSDPMKGLYSGSDLANESKLAVLRSSIASYILMRIIEGSDKLSSLSGDDLYHSGIDTGSKNDIDNDGQAGAVNHILSAVATNVNSVLNNSEMAKIQAVLPAVPGLPAVTFADVIAVAVAISDKLAEIGYTTCNATGGDFKQSITDVQAYLSSNSPESILQQLGPAYYLTRAKKQMGSAFVNGVKSMTNAYDAYLDCESGGFKLDDSGNAQCHK